MNNGFVSGGRFRARVVRRCGLGKCGVMVSACDNTIRIISSLTFSVVTLCRTAPVRRVIAVVLRRCTGSPRVGRRRVHSALSSIRRLGTGRRLFARSVCRGLSISLGGHRAFIGTLYLGITRAYGLAYSCYFTDRNGCGNSQTVVGFRINGRTVSFLLRGSKFRHGLSISFFNNRPLVT